MFKVVKNLSRTISTSSRFNCTPQIPKNVLEDFQSSQDQTKPGVVYDKKPFRLSLKKGMKKYLA